MKKNIILSIVFLLLIFNFGLLYDTNTRVEGMDSLVTFNIPGTPSTIDRINSSNTLTMTNVLVQPGRTLSNSAFCAKISEGQLKLMKNQNSGSNWTVIWESIISSKNFTGNTLTLSGNRLVLGTNVIVDGLTGATSVELVNGDLLVKNISNDVLWSLLDQEINTAKSEVQSYMQSSETVRATLNARNELKDKLTNLKNYVSQIESTLDNGDVNQGLYTKMINVRRRMDFELTEINNSSGSKINISQTTLQSTMYVNLAITVLIASLFVLLYSR